MSIKAPTECPVHAGQLHGGEARELRELLEELCTNPPGGDIESNRAWCAAIQSVMTTVDERDSLAHIERSAVTAAASSTSTAGALASDLAQDIIEHPTTGPLVRAGIEHRLAEVRAATDVPTYTQRRDAIKSAFLAEIAECDMIEPYHRKGAAGCVAERALRNLDELAATVGAPALPAEDKSPATQHAYTKRVRSVVQNAIMTTQSDKPGWDVWYPQRFADVVADRVAAELAPRLAPAVPEAAPVLSAEVLRGLQLMRLHLDEGGHDWRDGTKMADVEVACAWLDRLLGGGK